MAAELYGVREALASLRAVDPKLRRESVAEIKAAAGPLQRAVSSRIPGSAPLSGMEHKGRTGWRRASVRTKVGGRKAKGKNSWPLVSVIVTGASASIFDMAGRGGGGSSPQGHALVAGLSSRHGGAARASWPGAEATMHEVEAAVTAAVAATMKRANVELVRRGGA